MRDENKDKLTELFGLVFEIEEVKVIESMSMLSESNWDSLRHTSLVAGIEDLFQVSLSMDEIANLSSYKICEALLEEKGL
jgi:acyl carrier protein